MAAGPGPGLFTSSWPLVVEAFSRVGRWTTEEQQHHLSIQPDGRSERRTGRRVEAQSPEEMATLSGKDQLMLAHPPHLWRLCKLAPPFVI